MAEKLLKRKGGAKIAAKKLADRASGGSVTIVGTYKDKQLAWIGKNGIYNYPVRDGDELTDDECRKITELWLYADAKGTRHAYVVTGFVGKMSRGDFLKAYPTYPKKSSSNNKAYYVFSVKPVKYDSLAAGQNVVVRTADFGRRTAKIKKAVEQFKKDGEFAPLAAYLPSQLADVPKGQLRVCEAAVQMEFFEMLEADDLAAKICISRANMRRAQKERKPTCVEICAGAGGQAIGLERAGFAHVALVEYESEYCDVLRNNNPDWNVICADVHKFDGRPYEGVDLFAGGVPCPPFSVASKQLGEEDERDLFPEAIRLIGEIKPKAVMIENVRGLLDPKFDEYRNSILRKLDALGYDVQIKLLHASDFGVPQIRPRVVIVGIKKSLRKRFVYPAALATPAPTVGEALGDLMAANGWRGVDAWKQQANSIAPTVVGGSKKHGGPDLGPTRARKAWAALSVDGLGIANEAPARDFVGNPKLTKEMIAVIQGFPREWNFGKKKTAACRMIGNAFPPPVAMAVGQQIMRCLQNEK